jgi:hypothetical protein
MSTPSSPSSNLARWAATIGTLGLAIVQLTTVPQNFHIEAYLGVVTVLAAGMALTTAGTLFMSGRRPVWVFALFVGVLNATGYLFTRLVGLPLAESYLLHQWSQPQALIGALLATVVAGVAGWTLYKRRGLPHVPTPVTSAQERELLLRSSRRRRYRRSGYSGSARKTSSKSPR